MNVGDPDFALIRQGRTLGQALCHLLRSQGLIVDAKLLEGAVQGAIVDPGRAPQPVVDIVNLGECRLGDRVGRLLCAITPVIDFGRSISEVLDRHREVNLLTEDGHHVAVKAVDPATGRILIADFYSLLFVVPTT